MRHPKLVPALAALSLLLSAAPSGQATTPSWPQFRGANASGVADGQRLPDTWSAAGGTNIRWTTAIPGLSHGSPIVWGDTIYLTSAVSQDPNATFKPGLYGAGDASADRSVHKWMLYAVDRATGRIRWERVAYEGVPKQKRHVKSTYASSTPATDGRIVVAFFGSQGLHAFDMNGKRLWERDLGRLDVGAYDLPDYEWGTASSPIIDGDRVIVQADQQKGSFLLAVDAMTGKDVWKTMREELPSWGTPTVYRPSTPGGRAELVTNASNFVRGYDPRTGKELWRLGGSSKITAPTPIFTDSIIIVASGRAPERPIFAIRPGASGDITAGAGGTSPGLAWSKTGRGSYMPTPIIYGGRLYVLSNAGLLDAYDVATGAEVYRQRLDHRGSGFSASPVAADGRLYFSSEDGEVYVVKAGPEFAVIATNPMGEPLMATPALVGGTMYVRGERHLFAVGPPA